MKKRFTEEQIIKILEEGRSGLAVGALCRKYAIAPALTITGKQIQWRNDFSSQEAQSTCNRKYTT